MKGKVKHPGKYRSNVETKVFEDLGEKPIRSSALMRVKAVQGKPDVLFSNAGLCAWLDYRG